MNENSDPIPGRADESFKQMMELAKFGADRHEERRQLVFKIFVSFMTLLVVIAGVIMKYWDDVDDMFESPWAAGIIISALGLMAVFYWNWLIKVYKGLICDIRRRDFYLLKAEVLCYRRSKGFADKFDPPSEFFLNLGSGNNSKITDLDLFKTCEPDIGRNFSHKTMPLPISIRWDDYFLFNLILPLTLTSLMVAALTIKSNPSALYGLILPFLIGVRLMADYLDDDECKDQDCCQAITGNSNNECCANQRQEETVSCETQEECV